MSRRMDITDIREADEPPLCPCGKGYVGHADEGYETAKAGTQPVLVSLTHDDATALATFCDHSHPDLPPSIGTALNEGLSRHAQRVSMGRRSDRTEHEREARKAATLDADIPLPKDSPVGCEASVWPRDGYSWHSVRCTKGATVTRPSIGDGKGPINLCGTHRKARGVSRYVSTSRESLLR